MGWTREDRRLVFEGWGEELHPTGWRAWRERLADRLGEDRALARWARVVVGGDGVLVTLALRAHARRTPHARALWVPDAGWDKAPSVWGALPQAARDLAARLSYPPTEDMDDLLARIRTDSLARIAEAGGAWSRTDRRLFDAPGPRARICVLKPRGGEAPPAVPTTVPERALARWWTRAHDGAPRWPARAPAMVGGMADELWILSPDPGRKGWEKEPYVRGFGLAVSPDVPISLASSRWWEAVDALIAAARNPAGAPGRDGG